ncbi:MAG: MMPL family transporter [Bifidobacteriaceae bacterium]|jgi:RND superfamily putative drug exporter|nr:MMPL family transporter [Bifidobacteriaceae bacterium]
MAQALYRIGRFSARRRLTVIAFWLVALAAAVLALALGGGTLASTFTIPGTVTAEVSAELSRQAPELAGMTGTVVFSDEDGEAFTAEQREQISAALADVADVTKVRAVVDPFAAEAERQATELELDQGQQLLDQARVQLDQGRAQLEAGVSQWQAAFDAATAAGGAGAGAGAAGGAGGADGGAGAGGGDGAQAPTAEQAAQILAQLEAQKAELDAQTKALDEAEAELDAQDANLALGRQLLDFAKEVRTVSTDGGCAVAAIMYEDDQFALPQESKTEVMELLEAAPLDGVEVDFSAEIAQTTEGLLGLGEVIGLGVAAIVLLVALRVAFAAALPVVTSLIGAGTGVAGTLALSGVVDMSSITPVLGIMLGLAVGIDYALFIMLRHRRELRSGRALADSIALATGTAGNAVVFAGATVVIALAALNVCGIPFLGVMGWVGAASVALAVLVAITLVPALLSLLGRRLLPKAERTPAPDAVVPDSGPGVRSAAGTAGGVGDGTVDGTAAATAAETTGGAVSELRPMSTGRAALSVVLAIGGLLAVAIPVGSMRLGLPDGSAEPTDSTSYRAFMAVASEFGPGMNGPLVVAARLPAPLADEAQLETQVAVATELMGQADVVAVVPAAVGPAGDFLAFQVIPSQGPASESTEDLVRRLRALTPLEGGIELGVAGQASGNIDISEILEDALAPYLAVVVGLSLLIMMTVFRSVLVPVIAMAGFVLSFLAALGAVVAVYQWGWLDFMFDVHDPGPVLNFVPLLLVGVIFGLAMDYQLFIGSGMREAFAHGEPARIAVIHGLRGGRAAVSAAALIMMAVFGGFIFSDLAMVRPLGFGLAAGVMFDAFVVRLVLVPALTHLAGPAAWWLPRWLDRVLPRVDLEGAALERGPFNPARAADGPVTVQ